MLEPRVIVGCGYVCDVAEPGALPVTLDELETHCRVESAEESPWLLSAARAATAVVERATNRRLITRDMEWRVPSFGPRNRYLAFPVAPLQTVTAVRYTPPGGGEMLTLDPERYSVESYRVPAAIGPALGSEWPETVRYGWAVSIDFAAGYGAAPEDVDPRLRQAILLMVAHMYEHRGDQAPGLQDLAMPAAARALIQPLRLGMVA